MAKKDEARSTWGSKREKSKGVWELRYTDGNGDRHSETLRGNKKAAERRLAELRVIHEGEGPGATLTQFWNHTYHPEIKKVLAAETIDSYERYFERVVQPEFGDMPMRDITARHIQSWISELTYSTAKHAKAVLSAMLSRAFALDLIDDNPAMRKFVMPAKSTSKSRTKDVYTKMELEEIACTCYGEEFEACFLLAAFGGGQKSEVLGVKPEEIELIDGYAVAPVKRGVHLIRGKVIVEEHAKNEFRESFLVVAPPHAARLASLANVAIKEGFAYLTDDGFGQPLNPDHLTSMWKRWFLCSTSRFLPFSNLRPSYSTWMRTEGYDAETLSRLLRHSGTEMLHKVYDRPTAEDLVARMETRGQ